MFNFFGGGAAGQLHREGHHQTRVSDQGAGLHLGVNGVCGVMAHGLGGVAVNQVAGAGEQELEVVVQLGHGAHGGARRAHRVGLVNGNGRGHALYLVHRRFVHAVQKLARIGRKRFHVAALAFGVQGVKHQARFTRAAGAGDHGQFSRANVEINVLEVVLTRSANADETLWHGWMSFL